MLVSVLFDKFIAAFEKHCVFSGHKTINKYGRPVGLYLKVVLCQIGGPNGPIWGGGVPHATQVTQAFGLGREVVGCASGDALWVSRKRDDQLRAS